jgi:hypothetical protein
VYLQSSAGESFAIQISMLGGVKAMQWNGSAWQ